MTYKEALEKGVEKWEKIAELVNNHDSDSRLNELKRLIRKRPLCRYHCRQCPSCLLFDICGAGSRRHLEARLTGHSLPYDPQIQDIVNGIRDALREELRRVTEEEAKNGEKRQAQYIEALRQGLEIWRDYEEHRDKPITISHEAICGFMGKQVGRLHKQRCEFCFLHKKGLCTDSGENSERPFWLMVVGDEQSPLYGELPDDEGRWDKRRKDRRGLHYPLFRGVMRRAIEAELRRVSGMGEVSPFCEEV